VVQQSATVAPAEVTVEVQGENTGAAVVATNVRAAQNESARSGSAVVQQMAADAPSNVQVTVSGNNNGVVAVGANVHVEQTVLPDDYVEVHMTYRCAIERSKRELRQERRRCR
jgi:membrane-bound lytic murein transglycosylase